MVKQLKQQQPVLYPFETKDIYVMFILNGLIFNLQDATLQDRFTHVCGEKDKGRLISRAAYIRTKPFLC